MYYKLFWQGIIICMFLITELIGLWGLRESIRFYRKGYVGNGYGGRAYRDKEPLIFYTIFLLEAIAWTLCIIAGIFIIVTQIRIN